MIKVYLRSSFCIAFILSLSLSACGKRPKSAAQQSMTNDTLITRSKDLPAPVTAQKEAKAFFESNGDATATSDAYDDHFATNNLKNAPATADKEITFDIPIVINEKVEKWLNYFQTRGRKSFGIWLSRSGKYIPLMKRILTENGLPLDLVYLSMIESGYRPSAYSHANASGLWQFIYGTGKRYGLRSNWWIDERRSPEKSSIAAAQYLKELYSMFDHWYLAAAGYNAGENKIKRAIKRHDTTDYWEMSRFRYLKPETKNYVPKIIAAAILAKDPEKYGFTNIVYDEPLLYSKVLVQKPMELSIVAKYLKVKTRTLKDLNPELLRGVTPPKYPNYELKIPHGMELAFEEAYPQIKKHAVSLVTRHKVRKGEAISVIARKYGVPYRSIMRINNMKSTRIRPGKLLIIPHRKGTVYDGQSSTKISKSKRSNVKKSTAKSVSGNYKVKSGDSLWLISRNFNVSVSQLKKWNNLQGSNTVKAGQNIHVQSPSVAGTRKKKLARSDDGQWIYYKVKSGDSIWSIAKKYGTGTDKVIEWNDLDKNSITLYPGNTLKIKALKS